MDGRVMLEQKTVGSSFSELSELQASLKTLQLRGVALEAGRFTGSVYTLDLGDLSLEVVRTSPALLIEAASSGRSGWLLLLEGASATDWDGKAVGPYDIASLQPCGSLMSSSRSDCACAFVSTEASHAKALLSGAQGTRFARRELVQVRRSSPSAHARLSSVIRTAGEQSRGPPVTFRDDRARRELRATLWEALGGLFSSTDAGHSPGGRLTGRQHVVRRADEFLCADPYGRSTRSIYARRSASLPPRCTKRSKGYSGSARIAI